MRDGRAIGSRRLVCLFGGVGSSWLGRDVVEGKVGLGAESEVKVGRVAAMRH